MYLLEQESSTKTSFSFFEDIAEAHFETLGVSVKHIAMRRGNEKIGSSGVKFACVCAGTRSVGSYQQRF